jgi:hypothetical protein
MGLALGIVLECDLIVAAAGTKFQVTETSRGLGGAYPSLAPLFKPITEFVPDSPLEGDGFEPSVPRNRERTSGAKSDLEDSRRRRIRQAE